MQTYMKFFIRKIREERMNGEALMNTFENKQSMNKNFMGVPLDQKS